MNLPLISILIPAYNAAPFLRRSVGSALAQTYANIEVVIVDDGSTDDTPAIADQLAADDRRIRVVHQENRGLAEAKGDQSFVPEDFYDMQECDGGYRDSVIASGSAPSRSFK